MAGSGVVIYGSKANSIIVEYKQGLCILPMVRRERLVELAREFDVELVSFGNDFGCSIRECGMLFSGDRDVCVNEVHYIFEYAREICVLIEWACEEEHALPPVQPTTPFVRAFSGAVK